MEMGETVKTRTIWCVAIVRSHAIQGENIGNYMANQQIWNMETNRETVKFI